MFDTEFHKLFCSSGITSLFLLHSSLFDWYWGCIAEIDAWVTNCRYENEKVNFLLKRTGETMMTEMIMQGMKERKPVESLEREEVEARIQEKSSWTTTVSFHPCLTNKKKREVTSKLVSRLHFQSFLPPVHDSFSQFTLFLILFLPERLHERLYERLYSSGIHFLGTNFSLLQICLLSCVYWSITRRGQTDQVQLQWQTQSWKDRIEVECKVL